ncbi:cysteine--tRNA ligase, partial [Candidatus Micrarchaeota archaeon]|nr:cysteine--tRNA ligase [Candidatus Micrarchaeota archaeon]
KMSKSLGNFITLENALEKFDPAAIRLFFSMTHYRSPVDYNEQAILDTEKTVERVFNTYGRLKEIENEGETGIPKIREYTKKFYESMDNDFDTPGALAAMFSMVRETNSSIEKKELKKNDAFYIMKEIENMFSILGIKESKKTEISRELQEKIEKMILEREDARENKDFKKADRIREELKKMGIILEDTEEGPRWKPA